MKKLTIPHNENVDFHAFGIVSSEKDYRLCFEINKLPDFSFDKSRTIKVKNPKTGLLSEFSAFYYFNPENNCEFYFIKNLQDVTRFVPLVKEADYILIINGHINAKTLSEIKSSFLGIKNIQSIFALKNEYIKHINLD